MARKLIVCWLLFSGLAWASPPQADGPSSGRAPNWTTNSSREWSSLASDRPPELGQFGASPPQADGPSSGRAPNWATNSSREWSSLASDRPPELGQFGAKSCSGCDCPADDCYTPCCDCTLPVTKAWTEGTLTRVRARLVGALGERLQVKRPLRIRMANPEQLVSYGGDGVQGLYDDGQITICNVLSRRLAVAVLAHEYGHAWQDENHPGYDRTDNSLREGFAEWVALQALKRFGFGSGGDILRSNRDPVYGGGLRWFLQVEENFGREAVFEQATTWLDVNGGRLPPRPPPKPKKAEKKTDDESVPDDMPESGDSPKSR